MQRHRFYAQPSQLNQSTIVLDADESHHLSRVLRLSEGAHVFVIDGEGSEWECEVSKVGKREVELKLIRHLDDIVESPLNLTLAQALIKGDKFDWVIQKATELGVTRIVPLITDHSDLRRAEDRTGKRWQRWRRIALEALKQCGRRKLVGISEPMSFEDFCQNEARGTNLIFSERGGRSLRDVASGLGSISELSLSVASEGGWSDNEMNTAERHGFITIHLGSRILRTETAAIVAVTLAQHLLGDMK
ncbi:MAG: 16S rRNA (uracil(1498)-N(3))-methyltransferase [Acidobacteria bacterium]|nr:16S rRNA (uracil(1498)-N(3))-methyltransferase [Acidobacteriota bacterium]MCI0662329.1 16S rRNA (uracil(1498)-N(3))-methyltransferase [Acidobacteriota bacterium]